MSPPADDASNPKLTCLLTVHGIGFQQPPVGAVPGYADGLHAKLKAHLPDLLADDPNRQSGPIYVQSEYPTGTHNAALGLQRLGVWDVPRNTIDWSNAPLVDEAHKDQEAIAHIALVYANLEDVSSIAVGSAIDAGIRSVLNSWRYLSFPWSIRWLLAVALGLRVGGPKTAAGPSLRVRSDFRGMREMQKFVAQAVLSKAPPDNGLGATVLQLANDVCAYVCRNDLRSRVRGFVREALFRLCARGDVRSVIVNSHSQGTVVAYDVLSGLQPSAAAKVKALYTFGSPLRKYIDFFAWGNDVGILNGTPWINVWDRADPVADPLQLGAAWHAGMSVARKPPVPPMPPTLFKYRDPNGGSLSDVRNLGDWPTVNNLANSEGGGLKAHNYWDNNVEVVRALADHLSILAKTTPAAPRPTSGRDQMQLGQRPFDQYP